MKSFEQLGQAAYAAFCKKASTELAALKDRDWTSAAPAWAELAPEVQACWVAVAQHLVAEVAALH
jgi:hypothetical protein